MSTGNNSQKNRIQKRKKKSSRLYRRYCPPQAQAFAIWRGRTMVLTPWLGCAPGGPLTSVVFLLCVKIKSLSTTLACALIFAFLAAAVAETEPKYPVWPEQVHLHPHAAASVHGIFTVFLTHATCASCSSQLTLMCSCRTTYVASTPLATLELHMRLLLLLFSPGLWQLTSRSQCRVRTL